MEIRRRLRRIGNSMMVAIPSQVVDDLKLKAGDYVLVDVKDSTILVRSKVSKSNDGGLSVGL